MPSALAAHTLYLPLYPGLSETQQDRVMQLVEEFYQVPEAGY